MLAMMPPRREVLDLDAISSLPAQIQADIMNPKVTSRKAVQAGRILAPVPYPLHAARSPTSRADPASVRGLKSAFVFSEDSDVMKKILKHLGLITTNIW